MQKFNCLDGSSWLDVCLNTYGNLDSFVKMLTDNSIFPESPPISGQQIVWDNTLVENQSITKTIQSKKIIFATLPSALYLATENGIFITTESGQKIQI